MSKIQFLPPVPVDALLPQRSRNETPLRDVLRDLRDGGTPPADNATTGTTMLLTAAALEMRGALTVSRVQGEILKVHNEGRPFYAVASEVPGLKGTIRVALVTRERFESTPAWKNQERMTHGHALPQTEMNVEA